MQNTFHRICGMNKSPITMARTVVIAAAALAFSMCSSAQGTIRSLKPSANDTNEIQKSLLINEASWQAYRQATLQVAAGGPNSPLYNAYRKLSENNSTLEPTIDAYTAVFSEPQFRQKLPPSFTPRQYATWVVAMRFYEITEAMTGKLVDKSGRPPGTNAHDQNYAFVHTHKAEVDALRNESMKLMGIPMDAE